VIRPVLIIGYVATFPNRRAYLPHVNLDVMPPQTLSGRMSTNTAFFQWKWKELFLK
jgi:hypothetical protein